MIEKIKLLTVLGILSLSCCVPAINKNVEEKQAKTDVVEIVGVVENKKPSTQSGIISVIKEERDLKMTSNQKEVEKVAETKKAEEVKEEIYKIEVTDREYQLLARVCMSECGGKYGEIFDGKVAVLETILNRVDMDWGTIEEVVTQKYQYSMANNGEPDSTVFEAVDYVLNNKRVHPKNMLYFRANHYHSFGTPYKQIGNHYFTLHKGE